MKACQRDYYYDGDTRDCRSCAHLCHQAEVQGRLKKCQDLCPVEDANEKAVTVTENLKSSSATLVSPDGITVQDASPHAVAIVCLMSFFLAVILLVAVVAFWRWKQRQTPRGPVRYDNRDIQTTEDGRQRSHCTL
ncbi:uncharacterized protein LOC124259300 isoform X2 [Haliotis rubra]|uniref:uncharacterized protein LOC124259300 isoform X2 n=1 Tax=Haliotis rubra TaxID=36100 RepID=UPI001EE5050C|nr:uncharacterized protein LOC124259300 isoform X2 [Haliotis rubra]